MSIRPIASKHIESAIRNYAVLHDLTIPEAYGFLARRSDLEIIFDLLGLSSTENLTRTIYPRDREMLIQVFSERGFSLAALRKSVS